jgi:type I restriction enzyme, S subunit
MAGEWRETSLGELIDIKHGFAFKGEFFRDEPRGDILLTPGNFAIGGGFKADKFKYYEGPVPVEFVLYDGDLIVTMTDLSKQTDTLGYPAFVPTASDGRRYLHNQRLGKVVLKAEEKTDLQYLHYLMCWQDFRDEVLASATGTTVKHTSPERIKRFRFLLPPLPEQHAIAHILGTLDDKIELNRRMNETLEAMARAIFQSWFVDFDPVRAMAEGRDPILTKEIDDLFPDSFEESELGEIPMGWRVKTIEDVAERVAMGPFGSSIKVETFVPEGVPIISGQHLHGFILEDSTFNFITREHASRLSNAVVQRGDVVFTHAGNIGQAAFIPKTSHYERSIISQRQFYMRCDLSQVNPIFIALYFNSPEGRHLLLANTSSSGVPSIARPVTYLRLIQIPVPSKSVLDAFERLVRPLLHRYSQNLDVNRTLAALRDTLLPKLISGDLRVKDAEGVTGGGV